MDERRLAGGRHGRHRSPRRYRRRRTGRRSTAIRRRSRARSRACVRGSGARRSPRSRAAPTASAGAGRPRELRAGLSRARIARRRRPRRGVSVDARGSAATLGAPADAPSARLAMCHLLDADAASLVATSSMLGVDGGRPHREVTASTASAARSTCSPGTRRRRRRCAAEATIRRRCRAGDLATPASGSPAPTLRPP